MKKNILKAAFVVVFVAAAGYTAYNSQKDAEMSDLAMANVEALARGEWDGRRCNRYKDRGFLEDGQIGDLLLRSGDNLASYKIKFKRYNYEEKYFKSSVCCCFLVSSWLFI